MAQPKLLIVKTSSLGDVVHMLPAITDVQKRFPQAQIDWVVEENFAEIPRWHPAVQSVFPIAIRRWRKNPLAQATRSEIDLIKQQIGAQHYDAIIDAQGLLKSAWVTRWAKGKRFGLDYSYAREPFASFFYQQRLAVSRQDHAIKRNRLLMAGSLDYSISNLPLDYGISIQATTPPVIGQYLVALHGTSRVDKEWKLEQWQQLLTALKPYPLQVYFPWGNARELARAEQLVAEFSNAVIVPQSTLTHLAATIAGSCGVIGMDTGLMHIAAALGKAGVALYPATYPELTGVIRPAQAKGELTLIAGAHTQDTEQVIRTLITNLGLYL